MLWARRQSTSASVKCITRSGPVQAGSGKGIMVNWIEKWKQNWFTENWWTENRITEHMNWRWMHWRWTKPWIHSYSKEIEEGKMHTIKRAAHLGACMGESSAGRQGVGADHGEYSRRRPKIGGGEWQKEVPLSNREQGLGGVKLCHVKALVGWLCRPFSQIVEAHIGLGILVVPSSNHPTN
jgi:hypothetical protein